MNSDAKYMNQPFNPGAAAMNVDALPEAIDSNEPVKQDSSKHILQLVATLYLLASIGGGVYMLLTNQDPSINYVPFIILGQGYLIYFIMAICCNKTRSYLSNIKSSLEYEQVFYAVKQSKAHFVFHIECYHYETRITHHTTKDKDGNTHRETKTHRQKVITHTATENIMPIACVDESGHIEGIMEQKSVIFLKYNSNYVFADQRSEDVFHISFDNFKRHHRRDEFQDSSFSYLVPGLIPRISFYTKEPISCGVFWLFAVFGFAYPYGLWVECRIARYAVQITKRLTM